MPVCIRKYKNKMILFVLGIISTAIGLNPEVWYMQPLEDIKKKYTFMKFGAPIVIKLAEKYLENMNTKKTTPEATLYPPADKLPTSLGKITTLVRIKNKKFGQTIPYYPNMKKKLLKFKFVGFSLHKTEKIDVSTCIPFFYTVKDMGYYKVEIQSIAGFVKHEFGPDEIPNLFKVLDF